MARTIILAVCALTLLIAVQQASAGKGKSSCVVLPVFVLKILRSPKIARTGVFVVYKLKPFTLHRCGLKVVESFRCTARTELSPSITDLAGGARQLNAVRPVQSTP